MSELRATGISRPVDNLGRVVIPKELTRKKKIRFGDRMEFFIDDDDEVVMVKQNRFDDLSDYIEDCANGLAEGEKYTVAICNLDNVVAVGGKGAEKYIGMEITPELRENLLKIKKPFLYGPTTSDDFMPLKDSNDPAILCRSIDSKKRGIGAVIIMDHQKDQPLDEYDMRVITTMTRVMANALDS